MSGHLFYLTLFLSLVLPVLTQSTVFVFDDPLTSQKYASISWNPPNVLDGVLSGCTANSGQASCEGVWWTELDASGNFMNTTHNTVGPSTSMTFTFIGDSVKAYFRNFISGAAATYILDGTSPVPFTSQLGGDVEVFQQPLIQLDNLSPTSHNLTIAYDSASYGASSNRSYLIVDAFVYTVPPSVISSTSSSAHSSTSSTKMSTPGVLSTLSTTSQGNPTSSANSPQNTTSSAKPKHTGAIAGGVVGGVAALLLIPLLIWLFLSRQRQRNAQIQAEAEKTTARPFIVPAMPAASSISDTRQTFTPGGSYTVGSSSGGAPSVSHTFTPNRRQDLDAASVFTHSNPPAYYH